MKCNSFKCVYELDGECEAVGGECIGGMCENYGECIGCQQRRGWSEQAPAVGMSEERMLKRTAEQIAADYGPQMTLPGDVVPDF